MKSARNQDPVESKSFQMATSHPLPLDLETAPEFAPRPRGVRAYVGGLLYIEGAVVLLMGLVILGSYWPPVEAYGRPANPVSKLGLWMVIAALIYMVVVGIGVFLYSLWKPGRFARYDDTRPLVVRARRYASMKRRTRYIFDNTITCEEDAEEAIHARNLY